MQSFSRWFQQVSDEGDVLYVFPKDYRSKLAAKSIRIKIEPFIEKAKVLFLATYIYTCFEELMLILGTCIFGLNMFSFDSLLLSM